MTYVYIACTSEDLVFVRRLSSDLTKADIDHWYNDGQATDEISYNQLKRATHILAVLSPAALLNERFLAALEFGKQNKLERIALRLAAIESTPPQLGGVLPLDFAHEDSYQGSLETLLEDLRVEPAEEKPQLPEDLMTALYSDNIQLRRNGIETLLTYRNAEEPMKSLARDELNALVFREQNAGLKTLLRTTIQMFEHDFRPDTQPKVLLPSKEELAKQAEGRAVIITDVTTHLWDNANRWYAVLGGLGVIIGLGAFIIGGHWAYFVPTFLVGLALPYLNIVFRQKGEFDWKMPAPLIGNVVWGLLVSGIASIVLIVAIDEFEINFMLVNMVIGAVFGLVIGWLSALELD